MRVVELPEAWRGRALVITDVADPEQWFAADDVPEFKLPKRRVEWMLSRIAARELARRRGIDPPALERSANVSYSHGHGYGAAAIDDAPIGIDLEVPRDIKPAAAHLFLTDDELRVAERCSLPQALLHFWCAKEAAWKQRGGAVPTLRQLPLTLLDETAHGLRFDAVETFAGELVVALTRRWHTS